MPRRARVKSESEVYHIMLRGINRQSIFEDGEDCERFLEILRLGVESCHYKIFAWCLMGNHVHLVMKFEKGKLDSTMKKIEVAYVYYYNLKYGRIGHLMQDRFKSEVIEEDSYLYTVVRYVHRNPVKAGICSRPEQYPWSSYRQYLEEGGRSRKGARYHLTDTQLILGMYGVEEFIRYTEEDNSDSCLEIPVAGKPKLTDVDARKIIKNETGCSSVPEFQKLSLAQRREAFLKFNEAGLNVAQISRLTGIARSVIYNALR